MNAPIASSGVDCPVARALAGMSSAPLISIHDVMPETMEEVRHILDLTDGLSLPRPVLLVVPGRAWQTEHLRELRRWADEGSPMAGHGWIHATEPRSIYHHIHSTLISRNVAEHLALKTGEIQELLARNHRWFGDNDLPSPRLYVPPAWAMGSSGFPELDDVPFRFYESLTGIYDSATRRFHGLPLAGFEADTAFRMCVLRFFNAANYGLSRHYARPLRIAIHPFDLRYRLKGQLRAYLRRARAS